jgi:hypothetical protein
MSNGSGTSNIGEIAAALSGVVAVFAALAEAGVIGEAQRNHGYWLLIAIGFVLLGAVAWLIATLVSGPNYVLGLRFAALACFAIGLFLGVVAIWQTQQDSERPAVSSAFDGRNRVLAVEATAHG